MREHSEVGSRGSSVPDGPEVRESSAVGDGEEPRNRPAPQLTLRLDRKVESANRALRQLTGYREDEIVGGSVLAFVHPEDMETLVLRLEALARDIDLGPARPFRIFCLDGHALRIDASLAVTRDANGCPASIVVTVMHATPQCSCATAGTTQGSAVPQPVPA
jgi:PAS domain S-box-containing protein